MKRQSEVQKDLGIKIGRKITALIDGQEVTGRITATRLFELPEAGVWGTVVFKPNAVNEFREVSWTNFKIVK